MGHQRNSRSKCSSGKEEGDLLQTPFGDTLADAENGRGDEPKEKRHGEDFRAFSGEQMFEKFGERKPTEEKADAKKANKPAVDMSEGIAKAALDEQLQCFAVEALEGVNEFLVDAADKRDGATGDAGDDICRTHRRALEGK
ncbi:MAG TPA: hypothetical protein DGP39_08635 [Verrucomicrobiales bacterium]|nr:hypothetical protein [Verrucomicrobiales bacterium]